MDLIKLEGTDVFVDEEGHFYVQFRDLPSALRASRGTSAAPARAARPAPAQAAPARRGRRARTSPEALQAQKEAVAEYVLKNAGDEGVARGDVAASVGLAPADAARLLKALTEERAITKKGERINTRYFAPKERRPKAE